MGEKLNFHREMETLYFAANLNTAKLKQMRVAQRH